MMTRIASSRNELYHDALELYQHYQRVVHDQDWKHFVRVGKLALPLPANSSATGRQWIKIAAKTLSQPS